MRSERDEPTIGISCGHRVPRVPVMSEPNAGGQRTKRYWCEQCGAYRMSGGKTTGLAAFDFLLELRDEIASRSIVVDVDERVSERGVAVMRALGATVRRRRGGT